VRIRLTIRAARQVSEALNFVAAESPSGAASVRRRLLELLNLLEIQPRLGQMTDRAGVRRLIVTPYPYIVDYRISADELIVLRFRHGARRP
jgi:plasmid stabilization system protein ParE